MKPQLRHRSEQRGPRHGRSSDAKVWSEAIITWRSVIICKLCALLIAMTVGLLVCNPVLAANGWDTYVNAPTIQGYGYNGAGQKIGIAEVGGNADGANTALGQVTFFGDWGGTGVVSDQHATGVTGVAVNTNNGIAPGATAYSFGFPGAANFNQQTNSLMHGTTGANGAGGVYGFTTSADQVKIWNMSFGATLTSDAASQMSRFIDYMANTYDDVITIAAGNSGAGGAGTVTVPGDAFNAIVVGSSGNAADAAGDWSRVRGTSGEGLTSDSRSKPNIVAPGGNITMPALTPPANATQTDSGTSFAAPAVAGGVADLRQMGVALGNNIDHRVMEAVLQNSADKDGGVSGKTGEKTFADKGNVLWLPPTPGSNPLDSQMGAGQMNLAAAHTQYNKAEALVGEQSFGTISVNPIDWDFNRIAGGAFVDYAINQLARSGSKLTATIDWDRIVGWTDTNANNVPDIGDTFTANALDNLQLYFVDSLGNQLLLTDALGRTSYSTSAVDNVEHIYFTLPNSDNYTVRVRNLSDASVYYGFAVWVPEPGGVTLMALGAFGLVWAIIRRKTGVS